MKKQLLGYLFLSITMVGLAVVLYFSRSTTGFSRFLGNVPPLPAVGSILLLGYLLLRSMMKQGWFLFFSSLRRSDLYYIIGVTLVFVIPPIVVDIASPYPEDTNILFPESLAFYPLVGFAVEILFHAIFIYILMVVLSRLFKRKDCSRLILPCILIAALGEPLFHVITGINSKDLPWKLVYIGVHNYFFNVYQLYTFRRYGFFTMYGVRLMYYLIWHVLWGFVRLRVLF